MSGIGVVEVSDFFLNKESMSPKKLQKLTYYAEAWHQALLNEKLINDDNFEAWVHYGVVLNKGAVNYGRRKSRF